MKVLLANNDCQVAGTEMWMVNLATRLRARGHEAELFFFERGPMAEFLPAGLCAHYGDLGELMKLVRRRDFDIVHGNSSDWHQGLSAVGGESARLILTAHGWIIPEWNSANCDALVCCSQWQTEEQQAFTDLPVTTIINGIDTERFTPSEAVDGVGSMPIVAWVGRGVALVQKRIDKLAAIAPDLARRGMRLWIADPYGADELQKVAPDAADTLRPIAEFWDKVPVEKMPDFYRDVAASGGCILSTSSFEGLPLALAEAQGCGCPVIGADVRGINECVSEERGGTLYPFDAEPDVLARLIIGTLKDADGMRRRRDMCARYVRERFSLERMADEYAAAYEQAVQRKRRGRRGAGARKWVDPIANWDTYVERRWRAGHNQYQASRRLAERGEGELARTAVRASFVTCPTLYANPARLTHFLRMTLRHGGAGASDGARG